MQIKRRLAFFLFVLALMPACGSLASSAPTPDPLYIESLVKTEIASMPTNTQPPSPAPASTLTPTVTLTVPTPTLTLFYQPSVTPTPSLMDCPLIVTVSDTSKGDILHVRRCEDNLEYDLGPFAKGVYAAGPENKFLVYVTDNGYVFVSKIGSDYLDLFVDLNRDKRYVAINRGVLPNFAISFTGEKPYYVLVLYEKKYKQKYLFDLPTWLGEDD